MFEGYGHLVVNDEAELDIEEIRSWFSEFSENRPASIDGLGCREVGCCVGFTLCMTAWRALEMCDGTDIVPTIALALSSLGGCEVSYDSEGDIINFKYEQNDPLSVMSFIKYLYAKGYLSYCEGHVECSLHTNVITLRTLENEEGVRIEYYSRHPKKSHLVYEIHYDLCDGKGSLTLISA